MTAVQRNKIIINYTYMFRTISQHSVKTTKKSFVYGAVKSLKCFCKLYVFSRDIFRSRR